MKKTLSVLLAVLMLVSVFALTGCGGKEEPADTASDTATQDDSQTADNTETESAEETEEESTTKSEIPDEPVVPDTLEIVKEIFDYNKSSHWIDYLIVLKNVSDETVAVECKAVCRDTDGKFISGANNNKIAALGPGQTSYVTLQFLSNPPENAKVSYVLTTTGPVTKYRDVLANLTSESEVSLDDSGKKQVTVTVKNNGEDEAQSVDALALCYDAEGNYVSFVELTYIEAESNIIPAGASGTKSGSKPGFTDFDYETAEVYLRAQSQLIF